MIVESVLNYADSKQRALHRARTVRVMTQTVKIQSISRWSVIFHPLLVGPNGPSFSDIAFSGLANSAPR